MKNQEEQPKQPIKGKSAYYNQQRQRTATNKARRAAKRARKAAFWVEKRKADELAKNQRANQVMGVVGPQDE